MIILRVSAANSEQGRDFITVFGSIFNFIKTAHPTVNIHKHKIAQLVSFGEASNIVFNVLMKIALKRCTKSHRIYLEQEVT